MPSLRFRPHVLCLSGDPALLRYGRTRLRGIERAFADDAPPKAGP